MVGGHLAGTAAGYNLAPRRLLSDPLPRRPSAAVPMTHAPPPLPKYDHLLAARLERGGPASTEVTHVVVQTRYDSRGSADPRGYARVLAEVRRLVDAARGAAAGPTPAALPDPGVEVLVPGIEDEVPACGQVLCRLSAVAARELAELAEVDAVYEDRPLDFDEL